MLYADLVAASQRTAATSKRTEKVGALAELLRGTPPEEVEAAIGLLIGEPRQGRLGVGWAMLSSLQVTPAPQSSLTIHDVDATLSRLARMEGAGSQGERQRAMTMLWAAATEAEQNHLYRVLTGELRQGANEGVVADAVARASGQPIAAVRRAAMLLGNLGAASVRALTGQSLDVGLTPLTAVQPMLAGTSASVTDALAELGVASVEWKLDGIRVQAHKIGDEVRLFSRGLNDITAGLPGVVDLVRRVPVKSVVLDGEALGIDEDGQPLIFQDTMSGLAATGAYFFDVLHLDDQSLIDHPLRSRRSALETLLPVTSRLPSIVTADADEAEAFAADAVATGHEGVMVKAIESLYEAGRRGTGWRKVKPVHTVDLVVLAAEWGHGRRVGWLSNLHLGARGADGFVMVGKTFKGMTDDLLRWQTEELQRIAIATEGHTVHVRPELVVEIALDGVQRSTRYPGGVALRFARVRRYRPDKTAQEADTIERVQGMLGGVR
ncbi:MAG: ATP-dependent DNA ligase [Ilumatobacteraceae bacterium]|nr:ATP-dependent DNA ligase [Ilumatobacteraceae bacterium]